jgi:hypothetical protein
MDGGRATANETVPAGMTVVADSNAVAAEEMLPNSDDDGHCQSLREAAYYPSSSSTSS